MNCDDLRPLLDDLVDGELSRLTGDEAAVHIDGCRSCREAVERTRRLAKAAASLPRELMPARDLWSGIETGLSEEPAVADPASGEEPEPQLTGVARRAATFRGYGAAAAMIAVVAGLGVVAAILLVGREGPRVGSAPATLPPVAAAPARAADLNEAQRVFLQAKQELREAFSQQRRALSPATVRKVDENLRIIEKAVSEIQGSLDRDPGNLQLERLLVAAQQREVALLRKVTRTAAFHQR